MLVKKIRSDLPLVPRFIKAIFKKKLFLISFIFISFVGFSFLFIQSSINNHKISNYILYGKGIVSNNFRIIPNYISGLQSDPDVIYINIKSLNIQKLSFLRNKALSNKEGVITEQYKNESVKTKLTYKGKSFKGELSLTGQNMDHINNSHKWSFRVNLKGEARIDGIKKFTLLVPHTRGKDLLSEFIGHKLMKYVGLISPRYDYKRVILNGKDYGIYAFEEHLDKRTLESNSLREGIIIKATPDSFKVFKEERMRSNELFSKQLSYLENQWSLFLRGDIQTKSLFNTQKLANYYAISDIINGQHTHYLGNEIFHFNPMTLLLEPIGREWDAPYVDDKDYKIFLNNISVISGDANSKKFQELIFQDDEFIFLYLSSLNLFTSGPFIDNFMKENIETIKKAKHILYAEYPYLDADENILYQQVDTIRTKLSKVKSKNTHYQVEDIIIDKPEWVISEDFVVKKNQKLIVHEGTHIDMIQNSGIISYGNIIFMGSSENPITTGSSDKSGTGISVFHAKNRSKIEHTIFTGIEVSKKSMRSLTSPVFFYESDVDILNTTFRDNNSEDMLNIFRSNFLISDSVFINSYSDAFDSDFSNGTIANTVFKNLGNDAIDLSGSSVNLNNIEIIKALDKAISLGENSKSYGSAIKILDSNLGISSKDLSYFFYEGVDISNAQVAFSIYEKKEEFGSSSGEVRSAVLNNNKLDFIIEEKSHLTINNQKIDGDYKNVKNLMYGNTYGTATSRE